MRVPTARRGSSPFRARQPSSLVAGIAALGAAVILVGCGGDPATVGTPEPSPTPLARLNTDQMRIARIEFCSLVPPAAVRDAVGGDLGEEIEYGNGDTAPLPGLDEERLQEIGCIWEGADGVSARAWLFARPVEREFARSVVASARRDKGCTTTPDAGFGAPSYRQECEQGDGGSTSAGGNNARVRNAGLFGQSWLSCEISADAEVALDGLRERTDAWCVEIANALNTTR